MSARHPFPHSLLPSGRKAGFMALLLLVSLLAHLFIIDWARDSLTIVSLLDDDEDVVQVTLHTALSPPSPKAALPKPLPSSPAPDQTSAPLPTPVPVPATETALATGPANPPVAVSDIAPDAGKNDLAAKPSDSAAEPIVSPAPETAAALTPTAEPATLTSATPPAATVTDKPALFSQFSLPPSANLGYDAVAIKGNSKVEGKGLVKWMQDGRQYSISGEASVLFLSVLSYRSEGHLTDVGILPEIYVEKRLGKSSTNTHFHRERQTISFSASTNSYPVKGGEQDRGSVFWQLAGLARGNPDKLQAGLSFELIIAGSRTADPWQVTVLGRESVAMAQGSTDAWHLRIVRQDGGADYQLEVWLAPAQDWYPVKILYVDRKGTTLGLTLATLEKK
jgi:Protein of unknown function (DUF3108)